MTSKRISGGGVLVMPSHITLRINGRAVARSEPAYFAGDFDAVVMWFLNQSVFHAANNKTKVPSNDAKAPVELPR